jgi:ArsR family transcriptional regulator, arsenate/arsenite/antimonite-responsive transcriptional repressor / arsenate reductase (thioredoxin)
MTCCSTIVEAMDVEERYRSRAVLHHALAEPHRLAIIDALSLSDRTPGALAEVTGLEMNLLAFHLGVLESAGLILRRRSSGDRRHRYVTLRHDALDGLVPTAAPPGDGALGPAERVLFVCTQNAARSQLAAALWRGRTGRIGESAGTAPARSVHPLAVAIAGSRGVDLSRAEPRALADVMVPPDLVVTVCDRALESGVPFADRPHLHWSLADPAATGTPAAFARAYDEVAERVEHLAEHVAA